jgi:hypothetical protein
MICIRVTLIICCSVIPLPDVAEVRRGKASHGFRMTAHSDLLGQGEACLSIVGSDTSMDIMVRGRPYVGCLCE